MKGKVLLFTLHTGSWNCNDGSLGCGFTIPIIPIKHHYLTGERESEIFIYHRNQKTFVKSSFLLVTFRANRCSDHYYESVAWLFLLLINIQKYNILKPKQNNIFNFLLFIYLFIALVWRLLHYCPQGRYDKVYHQWHHLKCPR